MILVGRGRNLHGLTSMGMNLFTKERLYRAIVNSFWREKFGVREVEVLTSGRFDHKLILLRNLADQFKTRRKNRKFRFEAHWLLDKEGEQLIENSWSKEGTWRNSWRKITHKLECCSRELTK